MGLAEGCRLAREVEIDEPIAFDDVERPSGRLMDELWNEQLELFSEAGER
jgi:predicted homoserine dehydrogenase-like protein